MPKKIVIVESPTKSKTLTKYLGQDFKIIASMGHIVDLPERQLSVDIKDGFKPNYIVIPGKQKILDEIRHAVKNADEVFLASDPDREGEAIAYHIANLLGIVQSAHRVLFNEITKDAVRAGIENPTRIDINKVEAQQARRILDRLVGYMVSPFLWKIMYKGLSAGRVQSVALKILAKRDAEIEAFVPQEFWSLDLKLLKDGFEFPAKVTKFKDEKLELPDEKITVGHLAAIQTAAPFIVSLVERKKQKRTPPPPFITSTLQLEASRKLGLSAKKTMQIAQQLYEGIELGEEGPTGLITYMRTDSVRVADDARSSARKFIEAQFGKKYVGNIRHATSKSAQDAHEAIRPTSPSRTPKQMADFLSKEQHKLYELIWNRFMASQMAQALLQRYAVQLQAGDYIAETSETEILFDGFLKLWSVQIAETEEEEKIKLPPLTQGDITELKEITPNQHFTKPPPRYAEGTLVKELEAQGIGRPSTYAQIISTLLGRKYVESEQKKLFVTDLGKQVNSLLQKAFPDIFEEKFTAKMEEELDEVERGEKRWQKVLQEFYDPFSQKLDEVDNERKNIKKEMVEAIDRKCPKCNSQLVIRWGKFGRFIACSTYPECTFTEPLDEAEKKRKETTPLEETCPQCGAQLLIRQNKWGIKFVACSQYPKCNYSRSIPLDFDCPRRCGGKLVERISKRGKKFYSCNTDGCDFVAFDEPTAEACPLCGVATTFVKRLKKGDTHYCILCNPPDKGKARWINDATPIDEKCPQCGAQLLIRQNKWGKKFVSCSQYPKCKYTRSFDIEKKEKAEPLPTIETEEKRKQKNTKRDETNAEKKRKEVTPLEETCPKCGAQLLIRSNKWGTKFIACSQYPKCDYSRSLDDEKKKKAEPLPTDEKCPECGGQLLVRKNRWGGEFIACSQYPKCKYSRPIETEKKRKPKSAKKGEKNADKEHSDEAEKKHNEATPLDENCPQCGAQLLIRKSKWGAKFVACSQYPKCKYSRSLDTEKKKKAEPLPTDEKCPECGGQLLVRKNRWGGEFIACSQYPKCKYLRSMETEKKGKPKGNKKSEKSADIEK